jgi:glutamyl-tRNA synthetase
MQRVPLKQKVSMVLPFLQAAGYVTTPPPCEVGLQLTKIVSAAGERIKTAGDILDYADFFTPDDQLKYDEKIFEKRLLNPPEAKPLLAKFRGRLAQLEPFDAAGAEQALKEFCEAEGVKIGDVIHALRAATTGKAVGFGMFETLEILGRQSALARIDRALSRLSAARA